VRVRRGLYLRARTTDRGRQQAARRGRRGEPAAAAVLGPRGPASRDFLLSTVPLSLRRRSTGGSVAGAAPGGRGAPVL